MLRNLSMNHNGMRGRIRAINIQQSLRWNWQGVLTKHFDRASGTYKYDDWDNIMLGSAEPMKGNVSLLQKHLYNEEHTKPKEVKRMTNAKIVYDRQIKRIDDLTKYIKFMRDHPKEFDRRNK